MKKTTALFIALAALFAVVLTSCEDENIAYDLEGTWKGDMYMVRDGRYASYTQIEFVGNPFSLTRGTGEWLDQYSSRPNDYFYSRIEWKVKDRKIYIWLLDDCDRNGNPFELVIWDYELYGDRFNGYVDYEGGSKEFNLYRTYDPHWDDYYYSKKSRAGQDKTPEVHTHSMRQD